MRLRGSTVEADLAANKSRKQSRRNRAIFKTPAFNVKVAHTFSNGLVSMCRLPNKKHVALEPLTLASPSWKSGYPKHTGCELSCRGYTPNAFETKQAEFQAQQ